jgi:photosystem II stability/assembly factor-like uncharacterized protein
VLFRSLLDIISPRDAFVPCGNNLCATHDSAKTWQTLKSNLNFSSADGIEYVAQYKFVSSTMGWAITMVGARSALWKTVDGGVTWNKLSPILVP